MKKYTLDHNTWRCGYDGPNKLGEGSTSLLNAEGFSCCLGQFAIQDEINPEYLHVGTPSELGSLVDPAPDYADLFADHFEDDTTGEMLYNDSSLAAACIKINDDPATTPLEKALKLKTVLYLNGVELELVNFPDHE